jgi:hypothetical protein
MVRLMCGAGHSRRNTVIFCSEEIELKLKDVLNNDRNKEVEISENKFNAYFALNFSGTQIVNNSYFTVIPDYEIVREERVDWVVQTNKKDYIEERVMPITFNCFDGQGLVSVEKAKEWSEELGLDYIPSSFIIRNSFIKGMVCTFDIHRFSDEYGIHVSKDIYGNSVNIRDMDLILTKSMFKGSSFYKSLLEYSKKCEKNDLQWGISRYSPKKDDDFVFSNYQFIQNLNLDDKKIEKLCEGTVEYLRKTMGKDISYVLLYLLGEIARQKPDREIINKVSDVITKSLLLNNSLIDDPYIKNHIIHSLNKKIKESYIGNLVLPGNYSIMISDPFALMEHTLGLPVKGLLGRDEHYSKYWIKKEVKEVAAMRAPLTWRSEVNKLTLKDSDDTNFWYQYLDSGVVYNIHGVDTMLQADSDFDGDLIMTTNHPVILDSIYGGIPITYDKGSVSKKIIVEKELWKVDQKSFNSPIGLITNYSTTMDSIIKKYNKDSEEYQELIQRLKLCRFYQGQAIDAAKNLNYKKMPSYWSQWTKVKDGASEEEKKEIELNNKLIVDKRPIFMRHIYSSLNNKYSKYNKKYDNYCWTMFGKGLSELLSLGKEELNDEEVEIVSRYFRFSPVIETGSVSNKVCFFIENKVKEIKVASKNSNKPNVMILQDSSIPFDSERYKKMFDLYKKYKSEKRSFANLLNGNGEEMFKTIEQYNKYIKNEAYKISSDICELANLAVNICYISVESDNKQFVWQIFGDGVVKNINKNRQEKIMAPFYDENGDIEYLGTKFSMFEIDPITEEGEFLYEDTF